MIVPRVIIKTQFYAQVRGKVKQKRDRQPDRHPNQLRGFRSLFALHVAGKSDRQLRGHSAPLTSGEGGRFVPTCYGRRTVYSINRGMGEFK